MDVIYAIALVGAIESGRKKADHYHKMATELNMMDSRKADAISDELETRSQLLEKQYETNIADLVDGIENMSKKDLENLLRFMFKKMD